MGTFVLVIRACTFARGIYGGDDVMVWEEDGLWSFWGGGRGRGCFFGLILLLEG